MLGLEVATGSTSLLRMPHGSCMVTLGNAHSLGANPHRSESGCIMQPETRMLGHTSGARSYAPIASRFLGANIRIHIMSVPVFAVSVLRLINNL